MSASDHPVRVGMVGPRNRHSYIRPLAVPEKPETSGRHLRARVRLHICTHQYPTEPYRGPGRIPPCCTRYPDTEDEGVTDGNKFRVEGTHLRR